MFQAGSNQIVIGFLDGVNEEVHHTFQQCMGTRSTDYPTLLRS
jgi:hypothetical protein